MQEWFASMTSMTSRKKSLPERRPRLAIRTPRLILRPVEAQDAEATAELMTEDISARLLTWPAPLSLEQVRERIAASERAFEERTGLSFAILLDGGERLIGWLGVWLAELAARRAKLGFWLGRQFEGRGYMSEAAMHAVHVALNHVGARSLEADTQPDNLASQAILRRLGMVPAGERILYAPLRDRNERCLHFRADGRGMLTSSS